MRLVNELRLGPEEFRLLRELFNASAGLSFGPESRFMLERRLRERITSLGLASFGEYVNALRFGERASAELEEAIDLCTVNETYFFREDYQLKAFGRELLPELLSLKRSQGLSIWSAGCSTGEEVYTIAITLLEADLANANRARILGTDISRRCLSTARRGIYGASSFRATPPSLKARYFEPTDGGFQVVPEVKPLCHFGHFNLVETQRAAIVGRVDCIFCRNVLIYFDDASRRRVIDMFYDRLVPGGYLLLGHSESLLNVPTAFELVQVRDDLVYRKPRGALRADGPHASSLSSLLPPSHRRR